MPTSTIIVTALALATVGACGPSVQTTPNPASGGPLTQSASTMANMEGMTHYTANLASVGSSTVHGTATVHSMNDQQSVELQIAGGPPSATLPWHIHTGSCADGATPVVGNPAAYTALGTSGDGSASMMITLPITLSPDQRYHVNVHASPTNMGTIVACGDLTK